MGTDLTLKQIAAWQNIGNASSGDIIARPPSLQRGAVWSPGQVELLWDSIMREFPIGAFVVCDKLDKQKTRNPKLDRSGIDNEDKVTHHLLDGQQRANAIALGFDDPFAGNKPPTAVLYLDLDPIFSDNSTRNYLFRATTTAHPWGYAKNDEAKPISAGRIREAIETYGWRDKEGHFVVKDDRPLRETWPIEAQVPIPFSWLLIEDCKNGFDEYWRAIRTKIESGHNAEWVKKVIDWIEKGSEKQRRKIFNAICRVHGYQVPVLEVPSEALTDATEQESNASTESANIANVEHLFQRLNSAGTELKGEELAYSMIKAYWPEVEEPIEKLSEKRMPASRLVMLGARVSLIDPRNQPETLPNMLSVSALRRIAQSNEEDKDGSKRRQILSFFTPQETAELKPVLFLIDSWLNALNSDDDIGLPPVLHTSLAQRSPDVYLLLMWLSRRVLAESNGDLTNAITNSEILRKPLLGLATTLHWFGNEKERAVRHIYNDSLRESKLEPDTFRSILTKLTKLDDLDEGRIGCYRPLPPEELDELISLPNANEDSLKKWVWWSLVKEDDLRQQKVWPFLDRLKNEKELLLYAQRDFLKRKFNNYDPSRQDLWEDHNRPWDYDHILPSVKIYGKQNIFEAVRHGWAYILPNLRAWPMEDNRSDQSESPADKINSESLLSDSFVTERERDGFAKGYEDIQNPENALCFIKAAKSRLLRIYGEWYNTLDIKFLTE